MDKLTCVFVFLVICGCSCSLELPVDIYLDENWDIYEEEAILSAMDAWEDATGTEIFNYMGRYDDEIDMKDYRDNILVVYKATSSNEFIIEMEENMMENFGTKAIAFSQHRRDVVFLWYRYGVETTASVDEGSEYYLWRIRKTTMHELGHLLGFDHNDHPESIMNVGSNGQHSWPEPQRIIDFDVEVFCDEYDCN